MSIKKHTLWQAAFAGIGIAVGTTTSILGNKRKQEQDRKHAELELKALTVAIDKLKTSCGTIISNHLGGTGPKAHTSSRHVIGQGIIALDNDGSQPIKLTKISNALFQCEISEDLIEPVRKLCDKNGVWLDVVLKDLEDGRASIFYKVWHVNSESLPLIKELLSEEDQDGEMIALPAPKP